MRLKLTLYIGFPQATARKTVTIDPGDIEDMTDQERDKYFDEIAEDWKNEKAEVDWEIEE